MQSEAIFENIAERIEVELKKANKSVFIAVAWFTNRNLFAQLLEKSRNGCAISIIISDDAINQNCSIDFDQLNSSNSRVFRIGDGDTKLMHNKFCVIDQSTVITGSYNWSYKAESNFENVILTYEDTTLAEQFIAEFYKIRSQYFADTPKLEVEFPLTKIIKRLEILKNYILLEDTEELNKESGKLAAYDFNTDIQQIINEIQQEEFAAAITKIQNFISRNQQLTVWNNPEVAALKLQIKNLENKLNAYDNERIELEKLLSEFQHRHTIELGNIILEILKLRKLKFKEDKAKYEEAEADEREYQEQVNEEKDREIFELTDEEKKELKKLFRKTTVLCHPDKVSDEYKEAAQQIFIELKKAYDANDLKKVKEINNDLERGNYFKSRSETVTERDLLIVAIAKLRHQIKILETEIINIKQNETYKTISSISDWDYYFSKTKEKLQRELDELVMMVEA